VAVGARLVRDVGEAHRLARLLLHRAQERGALAPLHVVGHALAELERAVVAPDLAHLLRHRQVLLQLALRYRSHESVNVRHELLLVVWPLPSPGWDGSAGSRSSRPPQGECARRPGSPRSGPWPRSCRSRRGSPWSRRTARRSPRPCRSSRAPWWRSPPAAAPRRRRNGRSCAPARRTPRSARRACWRGPAPRRIRDRDISSAGRLPFGFHFAKAFHRGAVGEVLELVERPHLDLAAAAVDRRIRKALCPLDRFLARFGLDDGVARHQVLGLGERAVDEAALLAVVPDAPALPGRLEARGVDQHAGFLQLLVVLAHLGEQALGGHGASLRVLRRLDQDHEAHGYLLEILGLHPLVERAGPKSTARPACAARIGARVPASPIAALVHRTAWPPGRVPGADRGRRGPRARGGSPQDPCPRGATPRAAIRRPAHRASPPPPPG